MATGCTKSYYRTCCSRRRAQLHDFGVVKGSANRGGDIIISGLVSTAAETLPWWAWLTSSRACVDETGRNSPEMQFQGEGSRFHGLPIGVHTGRSPSLPQASTFARPAVGI